MKVVIINKSDSRGGAAVVSRRLMAALRREGVDASMLVVEKLTDDPHVHLAAPPARSRVPFLKERLGIFLRNGLNRRDLFKADTASDGLPLWKHPLVSGADLVCLGWVNQGVLSIDGICRIGRGKPLVWVMHDMWCATGLCHHTGRCEGFRQHCGNCPLLHSGASPRDLSYRVLRRKQALYDEVPVTFVAVSSWLRDRCRSSALMAGADIRVIGNPFPLPERSVRCDREKNGRIRLLMAAARLDDPIKGLPVLLEALRIISAESPGLASRLSLTAVGALNDPALFDGCPVDVELPGSLPVEAMAGQYRRADLLLSPSLYETLPGTLVEAQAYGAVPVAFDSGGQRDIVEPGVTGVLARMPDDLRERPAAFARAISQAAGMLGTPGLQETMYRSVRDRFADSAIAREYIRLFNEKISKS